MTAENALAVLVHHNTLGHNVSVGGGGGGGSCNFLPALGAPPIEAMFSDGEPFGPVRLREFAVAQGNSELATFASALMNAVSIHEQEDDLTIVVAEAL
jgi:hypothetical protein